MRNVLRLALSRIPSQSVRYYAFTGKATTGSGRTVNAYADFVTRAGSMQPLAVDRLERLGLDMAKSYVTFYGPGSCRVAARDGEPDRFGWNGRLWEALKLADWAPVDGWSSVICVDVGPDE